MLDSNQSTIKCFMNNPVLEMSSIRGSKEHRNSKISEREGAESLIRDPSIK